MAHQASWDLALVDLVHEVFLERRLLTGGRGIVEPGDPSTFATIGNDLKLGEYGDREADQPGPGPAEQVSARPDAAVGIEAIQRTLTVGRFEVSLAVVGGGSLDETLKEAIPAEGFQLDLRLTGLSEGPGSCCCCCGPSATTEPGDQAARR